jgi:hypothetical protein
MKIRGPLHSDKATGTIVDFLTFSLRKEGQLARYQAKQKDVLTSDRINQRNNFLSAIERWNTRDFGIAEFGFSFYGMNPEGFEQIAEGLNITGYNLFLKGFLLYGE